MRTTVRINDELLKKAKRIALDEGRTLTSVIEEGLMHVVERKRSTATGRKRIKLPVSRAGGGVLPGVDLSHNASVEDIMDSE